jgi:hypothetical protein
MNLWGTLQARRDQPLDAQLAHIAERHRWAGWVLGGRHLR